LRSRRLRHGGVLAEHDLALAAQHVAAAGGERDRLVFAAHSQEALGEELADDATPFGLAKLGADAERLQLMMVILHHLRSLLAEQDVDNLPGAEALVALPVKPHDRGQQLLGSDRAVPHLRR
jgi:hypothetical protein